MKDETHNKRRLTPDRILLTGILVLQAAILTCLFWQPAQREPSLLLREAAAQPSGDAGPAGAGSLVKPAAPGSLPVGAEAFGPGEGIFLERAFPADRVFRHAQEMRARMDAAFQETMHAFVRMDDLLGNTAHPGEMPFPFPCIDMLEHGDAYVIVSSLPGIDVQQMSVVLSGRTLTLTALQESGGRSQRNVRDFRRTFRFPGPVVNDHSAAAWVSNGVLRVVIPKAADEVSPRRVLRLL